MSVETSPKCKACGEDIVVGAWKCSSCQTAQDWRQYLNFSVPVLSLCVALLAVIPDFYPTIAGYFYPAKIYVSADYDHEFHEIDLEFSNSGSASTFIPEDFECKSPGTTEKPNGVFFASAPVFVPAKSTVHRKYKVSIFNSEIDTIDKVLSSLKDRQEFFTQTRMNLTCEFVAHDKNINYYDFQGANYSLGFNILHNIELTDKVEFRFGGLN